MNKRLVITIAALSIALAFGLAIAWVMSAVPLTERVARTRAQAAVDEIARSTQTDLGSGYGVDASLVTVERFPGRLGLPAWQAEYSVRVTAERAAGFQQTWTAVRTFGAGAQTPDDSMARPMAALQALASWPEARRTALLVAIAEHLDNPDVTAIEPVSRNSAAENEDVRRCIDNALGNGRSEADLCLVKVARRESVAVLAWTGSDWEILTLFDPATRSKSVPAGAY